MLASIKTNSFTKTLLSKKTAWAIVSFIFFIYIFSISPPEGKDWKYVFYQVSQTPQNPYKTVLFINPPWAAFILYPFRYLSENISLAVNASLSMMIFGLLVIKRNGNIFSLALALTSYPFLSLLATGNIEWMLALAFIIQNKWALPLLLVKPQCGILAIISWDSFRENLIRFLVPAVLVIIISFVVWENWPTAMINNIQFIQNAENGLSNWNYSLFPWSAPLGIAILYYVVKVKPVDSEILGVLATLCLVPYFGIHSLSIFFTLTAASHRRVATVLWIFLWIVFAFTS